VEDRLTAGVYMELGNMDPGRYAEERAGELLRLRGVSRVSWWENCSLDRTDLRAKVPDGTLLGVAEVDEEFVAPDAPPGVLGCNFARHPRPSQGILSGQPTTGLLVVWISPKSLELSQPLRDWADFVHLRHIAAAGVPGFTQITPFDHTGEGDPRYMHLYELDTDDPEATFAAMPSYVVPRLGGTGSEEYHRWADLGAAGGYIVYVNTFRLLGARQDQG